MKSLKNYKFIKNDMYNISKRIKKIDNNYFILFNLKSNKYEVHNKDQLNNSYCFQVSNNKLDKRVLDYAFYSSVKNMNRIIDDIDKKNNELDEYKKNNFSDISSAMFNEIYRYNYSSTKEFNPNTAYKNKWL